MAGPTGLQPASISTTEQRILLVINEQEFLSFLPDGLPKDSANVCWKALFSNEIDRSEWAEILKDFAPTILMTGWSTPALTDEIIESPWFQVKYICNLTGSVRRVVPQLALKKGILVSNWGTLASTPVAEHAILLTLASLRQITRWKDVASKSR
ncbi:MAG: hypothetical protein ACQKBW_05580, partial [Puniceicoccales bacterium]